MASRRPIERVLLRRLLVIERRDGQEQTSPDVVPEMYALVEQIRSIRLEEGRFNFPAK